MENLEELIRNKSKNIEWKFDYVPSSVVCTATAFGTTVKFTYWLRGMNVEVAANTIVAEITDKLSLELFYKC